MCCRQPLCCFSVDNMMMEGVREWVGKGGGSEILVWLSKAVQMKMPSCCQQDCGRRYCSHISTEAYAHWSSTGTFIYHPSCHRAQDVLPSFRCAVYLLLFPSISSFIFSFPPCFLTTSALYGEKWGKLKQMFGNATAVIQWHTVRWHIDSFKTRSTLNNIMQKGKLPIGCHIGSPTKFVSEKQFLALLFGDIFFFPKITAVV